MKHLFTGLAVLLATLSFSQTNTINETPTSGITKITGLSVSVNVDSAKEVESTFSISDIEELLNEVGEDQDVSFEIICNEVRTDQKLNTKLIFKVNGNTSDKGSLLKSIQTMRNSVLTYYKNRK